MPRRTMTATLLYLHEKRKPDGGVNLSVLPDGRDFLVLFASYLDRLRTSGRKFLVETANERYARIDALQLRGRSLEITAAAGHFGEAGDLVDIDTHTKLGSFTRKTSTAVETHALALVPQDTPYAIVYIERARSANGLTKALGLFEAEFANLYPELMLKTSSIVESAAWVESAALQSVRATSYHVADDKADGQASTDLGVVTHVLGPERGGDSLPKRLYGALRENTLSPNELLGISGDHEVQRVDVTMRGQVHGQSRTKTFEVHNAGSPSFRQLISDHGQSAPTMSKFRSAALDEAVEHFKSVEVDWSESDATEKWQVSDNPLVRSDLDGEQVERSSDSH